MKDAVEAIQNDPIYLKSYHRLAQACIAMSDSKLSGDNKKNMLWKARKAYEDALIIIKTEEKNSKVNSKASSTASSSTASTIKDGDIQFFRSKLSELSQQALNEDKYCDELMDLEHLLEIFKHLSDIRLRLGLMANFWNAATQKERFKLFRRLLILIKANVGDESSGPLSIGEEKMLPLPMHNYEDIHFPPIFLAFFTNSNTDEKSEIMESIWNATNETEKDLILKDFKFFYSSESHDVSNLSKQPKDSSAPIEIEEEDEDE